MVARAHATLHPSTHKSCSAACGVKHGKIKDQSKSPVTVQSQKDKQSKAAKVA